MIGRGGERLAARRLEHGLRRDAAATIREALALLLKQAEALADDWTVERIYER